MAFDNSQFAASPMNYGRKGSQLDLSNDQSLGSSVKAIEVVQAGDLVYRPQLAHPSVVMMASVLAENGCQVKLRVLPNEIARLHEIPLPPDLVDELHLVFLKIKIPSFGQFPDKSHGDIRSTS